MKIGIVTYNMAADWDLETIFEKCGALGFDGVELRTTHAHGVEIELSQSERDEIKQRFADSPVTLVGLGSVYEYHSPDVIDTELASLHKTITSARRQIQRLVDGYQTGLLRADELSTRRASLEHDIALWSEKKASLDAQHPKYRQIQEAWQYLNTFCKHATNGLDTLSFVDRQKLLRTLVQRVWVSSWNVSIRLAIPLSTNYHLTTVGQGPPYRWIER